MKRPKQKEIHQQMKKNLKWEEKEQKRKNKRLKTKNEAEVKK